jgi:hypothetical protein
MKRIDARLLPGLLCLALCCGAWHAAAADVQRQADVAQRGPDVMPFSLAATRHVFTKTAQGGVQRVEARTATDVEQVRLIQGHLKEMQRQFLSGDFSGPAHLHGDEMPGLSELKAAAKGQLGIEFRADPAGAELVFRATDPALVQAIHRWFDAQLSDHGADAMAGHHHHHHDAPSKP